MARVALLSNPRSTGNRAWLPRVREYCAAHPVIFHYEVEDVDQKATHDIDEHIQEAYLARTPASVNIEVVIRVGKDWEAILQFAEEKAVDLIVMGRHGRSSLGKVLFGNVTEKSCRKAQCAVLIVPLSMKERKKLPELLSFSASVSGWR